MASYRVSTNTNNGITRGYNTVSVLKSFLHVKHLMMAR
jgi:hypothetical protein